MKRPQIIAVAYSLILASINYIRVTNAFRHMKKISLPYLLNETPAIVLERIAKIFWKQVTLFQEQLKLLYS